MPEEGQEAVVEEVQETVEDEPQETDVESDEVDKNDVDSQEVESEESPKLSVLKVNGEEIEVDESKLREYAQKFLASENKFEEAAKFRKETEQEYEQARQVLEMLQKDPMTLISKLHGQDFIQNHIKNELVRRLEEENMTPEQKAMRDYENKLSQRDKELKDRDERLKAYEEEKLSQQSKLEAEKAYQNYNSMISGEIERVGLPDSPKIRAQYGYAMKSYLQGKASEEDFDGIIQKEDLEKITDSIRGDIDEMYRDYAKGLEGENLEKFLGADLIKKVQQHLLGKAKTSKPKVAESSKPKIEQKKLTLRELLELDKQ